ncbi:MAG: aminotransferase class III-fold pyridoxal phosphate-dependent enzyme [Deltaproteobacteria bacterium]|nr:aminotransferase class III-fold pyridoxal phosphate-dependent enzyme [Deltaproteobacteria bacterium]MBW2121054.1 aminotransferase class III-fold pyridoxal phosphate-dependent enzyme [Deltaproteobacteria bacterium]
MASAEEKLLDLAKHTYGTWRRQDLWKRPLEIVDAEGVYMFDRSGKRYLDFSSQLMCSNLGHKNKAIIEAIVKQAEKLPYVAPGFATEAGERAVEALLSVMPENLVKFFFSTSGTEANEAALKMLRMYKAPDYKVISRYHSYHGATVASITFTGDPRRWSAERARCTVEGVRFAPDAYCYRCPFGLEYGDCNIQCARYLDYMIQEEGNVAAIIAEPVVGTNGRIVPPPEYFPIVREICDRTGVLLISDEVMSGWYRTGKLFAIQNWDVLPDILTTAKGCTAAYTPVGVTATSKPMADFFENQIMSHGHTYAFHPLALSAIPAAIAEYKKLTATDTLHRGAEHLKKRLYELADRHECIGDVRGMGHFWALELVKNRKTKELFNTKMDKFTGESLMPEKVSKDALQNGLFVNSWYDTMVISPPLIITEDQIDEGIDVLDKSLEIADREVVSTGVAASRSSEFGGRK